MSPRYTLETEEHADPDAPELIGTITEARRAAERYAELANTPLGTNDPGVMWATLAVASELRVLTLLIEEHSGMTRYEPEPDPPSGEPWLPLPPEPAGDDHDRPEPDGREEDD